MATQGSRDGRTDCSVVRAGARIGESAGGVPKAGYPPHGWAAGRRQGAGSRPRPRIPVHRDGSSSSLRCDSAGHQPHLRPDRQRQRPAGRSRRRLSSGRRRQHAIRSRILRPHRLPGRVQEFHAAAHRARRDAPRPSHGRNRGDPGHEPRRDPRTKATLERLRNRAYSPLQFELLVAESPFQTCEITTAGIGLEVRLEKR